jgi:hypothetical protein
VTDPLAKEQKKESPLIAETDGQNTPVGAWPGPDLTSQSGDSVVNFQFPKLDGEPVNGSFLTNPFNDNFGFGPLDTLSEFNFAEQDILSFLNPSLAGSIRDPAFTHDHFDSNLKPVVLQPDFVDWLQMNRDDYSFNLHHTSPHGLDGVSADPDGPNLIEPSESKEDMINPSDPTTSVRLDERTYAEIINTLQTKYKVSLIYLFSDAETRLPRFRLTESGCLGTIHLTLFRLL